MPSNQTQDQKLSDRANELYWRSERGVNQIAEDMELSKSRLYGLVRPLPAGSLCPQCQAELLFPNRTAKEKGFLSCPKCGVAQPATAAPESAPDKAPAAGGRRLSSKRVLWGSALLGVAAGLYLAIRQRRS